MEEAGARGFRLFLRSLKIILWWILFDFLLILSLTVLRDKKALDCLFIRLSRAFIMLIFLRTFSLFWSVYKFFRNIFV